MRDGAHGLDSSARGVVPYGTRYTMPKIFVLSGPDVGMSFEVEAGSKLGRAPDCAVVLRHASVSRHHAALELDGGSWWVVDLDSRNGLHIAGERVLRAPLADGSEFQLGEVLMRLRIPNEEGSRTAPQLTEPGRGVYAAERVSVAHDDEIVLEGGWDPNAAAARPPALSRDLPTNAGPPGKSSPSTNAAGTSAPSAGSKSTGSTVPMPTGAGFADAPPPIVREETARERATAKLAAAGALPKTQTGGRGILQFNKVEARKGFMTSELGQQPWWIQFGVGVLVLVVFVALIWLVFRGTMWFRSG